MKISYFLVQFDQKPDDEVGEHIQPTILELRSNIVQKWSPEKLKMDLLNFDDEFEFAHFGNLL